MRTEMHAFSECLAREGSDCFTCCPSADTSTTCALQLLNSKQTPTLREWSNYSKVVCARAPHTWLAPVCHRILRRVGTINESGVHMHLLWRELAAAIRHRRATLGIRQTDVRSRGGPGLSSVQHLETGARTNYTQRTIDQLEVALDWPPGTVAKILDGSARDDELMAPQRSPSAPAGSHDLIADEPRAQALVAIASAVIRVGRLAKSSEDPELVNELVNDLLEVHKRLVVADLIRDDESRMTRKQCNSGELSTPGTVMTANGRVGMS